MAVNLPPGGPQHVNLTFTPTWLFTPVSNTPNNVRIYNEGSNVVYVGQSDVTTLTGLPIMPGSKPLELTNVTTSLYAISAVSKGTIMGTVNSAATAGSNVVVITGGTFITTAQASTGQTVILTNLVNTANTEVVSLSAFGTTPATFTAASNFLFAHGTADAMYTATATYGQVRVDSAQL
jgi:hypothetical protein